jgi:parvulin-like peptidyl-prolyl isomerase
MSEAPPQNHSTNLEKFQHPDITRATEDEIANYLRRTYKIAEIAVLVEQDAIIIKTCEELGLTVSDEELQAAGDAFRLEHKLLGAAKTLAWLEQQRISAEDWTQGIRIKLLTQKLKEHLFADAIDAHYLTNREDYRQAAFSQILVSELPEALQIVQALRNGKASFCAMALEHSKAQPSAKQGGFVGIRFISTLMPDIKAAIEGAQAGSVLDPVKTDLGYHIICIEKWFATSLTESVRSEILEILFQAWLNVTETSPPKT